MQLILSLLAGAGLASAGLLNGRSTAVKRDSWGGSVSLGPSKSTIVNAVTTIIPGAAPATQDGELFLWPGMSNGTGDLIQTTLESWPSNAWCGATTGQWCVRASVFGSFGQLDGDGSPVSGTEQVRIDTILRVMERPGSSKQSLPKQRTNLRGTNELMPVRTVTNVETGKLLSTYSIAAGPYMTGYGTGTECDNDCTGTIAAQKYINTTITLKSADTTFGDTIATGAGATYTGLASSQGGKVWTIETMNIPAM
ncbi:hypothetical protein N7486_002803 [Penicillium sp. IBT 16267x]|nr:hypothetical protein N7486_002803 [Penicillium sp. IBT 16267x]